MKALALIIISISIANAGETGRFKNVKETMRAARAAKDDAERTQILLQLQSQPVQTPDDVDALYGELKSLEGRYHRGGPDTQINSKINTALSKASNKAVRARIAELLEAEDQTLPPKYSAPKGAAQEDVDRASLRLMRLAALAEAAGSGKNELALPALRKIFDKGGIAADAAGRAIGKIGKSEDLDRMIGKLKSDPQSRVDLTPFGGVIVARLMKEIDDPSISEEQRNALIARLGQARSRGNIEKYRALLHHKNPRVVKVAAQAVSENVSRDSGATAIQMVSDEDRQVRINGLLALQQVDWNPSYTTVVKKVLAEDTDEGAREMAAYVLGVKKVQGAEGALRDALNDNSRRVREAAQSALDNISGKHDRDLQQQAQEILKRSGQK